MSASSGSNSLTKQEEAQSDVIENDSLETKPESMKTESNKDYKEIPLLESTESVKAKTASETSSQSTGVKTKPLVKRVTWNLETEEKDEASSGRPAMHFAGVAQGSALGPVIFSCFGSNLPCIITSEVEMIDYLLPFMTPQNLKSYVLSCTKTWIIFRL
eukprot:g23132.t1